MIWLIVLIGVLVAGYLFYQYSISRIPAFPGAQGFGMYAVGGRGGQVVKVTTLDDEGVGSIRYALETMTGPRIVVFEVSGIVDLSREIHILHPYITVAGQTAPGDGIILRNAGITVSTHDVIIRGLKIRVGDNEFGEDPMGRDAIAIAPVWSSTTRDVYDVIIDHNEFAWAIDENVSVWHNGDPTFLDSVTHVTFSWNMIYEALESELHPDGAISMGLLIGEGNSYISLHHNLIAHHDDRNPRISNIHHIEFVNNLIYNWGGTPTRLDHHVTANIVNNYYRPHEASSTREIKFDDNLNTVTSQIYISGNYVDVDYDRGLNEGETRDTLEGIHAVILQANIEPIDRWFSENAPRFKYDSPVFPLTLQPYAVADVYAYVLNFAGTQNNDATTERIIASVENRTGTIIASQDEIGGWLPVRPYDVPLDSDNDGMPDVWELQHGLDITLDDSMQDTNGNGYTNIEDYINSFFAYPELAQ